MKQYLVVSVISALLGGLAAIALSRSVPSPGAYAQAPPSSVSRPATNQQFTAAASSQPGRSRLARADAAAVLTPEEEINIRVYESANRSVVNISTLSVRSDFFFESTSEGAGSGFMFDKSGHILTNYHVIAGAREIQATLFNGKSYTAGIVGQDPINDIAVLRITAPAETLFPVTLGKSTHLKVGQKVYAVGNPFGLERTMTVGIVSSLNRSLPGRGGRSMKGIIQIDAALNQGNSGGPLLNSAAKIIGMNTAIASRTGENTGVGFAIPVNTIRRVAPLLIEHGRVIRADLGVVRVYETERGLVIAALTPGGPAERAGLRGFRVVRRQSRRGGFIVEERRIDRSYADTIIAFDERPVKTAQQLLELLDERKPRDRVNITVLRDGRREEIPVTLGTEE